MVGKMNSGRQDDLIYDLGLHQGEDTEFYLKKGFRVVAIEANAKLCQHVAQRFADHIQSGQLTIVNEAIAEQPGEVVFFENSHSVWGTIDPDWAARNDRLGEHSSRHVVKATTMAELIKTYGIPYYTKIDIEGMDMVALRGFAAAPVKPRFVSIESDKISFRALRAEFETFSALGYERFKLVQQRTVSKQKLPQPAKEGDYVAHRFVGGSSGAFGEETPGEWLTADEAIEAYRAVFLRYALTGDDPYVRNRYVRAALKAFGFRAGWYDTHARLG